MNYRPFGKLDWQVSALGFGAMRLPLTNPDDPATIDEAAAIQMIRAAADAGVNYFDTAYPYHRGQSEIVVGKALRDGYRERVKIATKMPTWLIQSPADFDRYLNEQLERLQTDHIDFYLLHALHRQRWESLRDMGVMDWLKEAKASGRIRHAGFSFHDGLSAFKQIVDEFTTCEFCQIQYNYLDVNEQAGMEGLQYAAAHGIPVVIMEPMLGGKLSNPPQPVVDTFRAADAERTPTDWALQWLWDQPEVTLVLSGMSTPEQISQNIASAGRSGVNSLRDSDRKLYDQARAQFKALCPIPCTACGYCMPCPNGVDIPGNFEIFNRAHMVGDMGEGRWRYSNAMPADKRAENCIQCQVCEGQCPQKIEISAWMPKVHEALGKK